MPLDKSQKINWILGTILSLFALVAGIGKYQEYWDARHEPTGSVAGVAEAVQQVAVESKATALDIALRMESDNQNLQLQYQEILDECEEARQDPEIRNCSKVRVEDAREQLSRLDYNRKATVQLKERITGITSE